MILICGGGGGSSCRRITRIRTTRQWYHQAFVVVVIVIVFFLIVPWTAVEVRWSVLRRGRPMYGIGGCGGVQLVVIFPIVDKFMNGR